jgi:type I restriction-modification system DNA methylase subunit
MRNTTSVQVQLNRDIVLFLQSKLASGTVWNEEDLNYMQQYAGGGGLNMDESTDEGVLHEFYTPDGMIQRMWALAYQYGFTHGKILEPSAGTGRMLRYVDPANCTVHAFEIDETSGQILKACFPWANITIGEFESIFYPNTARNKRVPQEPSFDLVIGNPPYGKRDGRLQGPKLEGGYTMAMTLDQYFLEKGVELLKPNGLLVMAIPSSFLTNDNKYNNFKASLSEKAELMDAYRMPLGIFDFTKIASDIIVLRKK